MLTTFNTLVIKLVRTVPVPLSILVFSVGATLLALPLSLGSSYLVSGVVTSTDVLVTIVTTLVISAPVSYLICSVIMHLYRSESRLAEAQSALADQVGALAAARHDAVAANQAKSAFLAQMSHELRTPLNAVIGFADVIAKQDELGADLSRDDVIQYAGLISQGGNTLLSLVNDLLDLSKIEAGEVELCAERINVAETLDRAVSCVTILARNRGISVTVRDVTPSLAMMADKRALSQILVNLLSNAIKFSPPGGDVAVAVRHTARALTFKISDQGAGMSAEEQEKAVLPFAQLSNAMVACQKGTGLGLPIVKSLIELEGGTLRIHSAPGRGTEISVRYPAERVIAAEPAAYALSA